MEEILEGVLKEFSALAAIPRPSHHEAAVGEYLAERLKSLGLTVERDEIGNVIGELKPSIGCENVPRVILQAHMDMVCVADEGVDYNPLTDPIKLLRADGYLTADGTSLGADDGIGISIIIYIIKNFVENPALKHGAIRVIFTVDEEAGMSGASNLNQKYVGDAQYFINCDSENCDELVVGSAGSVHIDFERHIRRHKPKGTNAFQITISGLRGGHSGEEINSGRANAIKLLAELLSLINENGGAVEINHIEGGKAANAIAARAEATISTMFDVDHLKPIVNYFAERIEKIYGAVETDCIIKIDALDAGAIDNVIDGSDEVIALINRLHYGVIAMATADLVETSANVGVISIDNEYLTLKYFPRSSRNEKLLAILEKVRAVANELHFNIKHSEPSTAWTENPNSRLARLIQSIYRRQNNHSMTVKTIHAGLECSYFIEKNPALDIVSIGTTNEHIHSPRERLKLSTVAVQTNLLGAALIEIADNV